MIDTTHIGKPAQVVDVDGRVIAEGRVVAVGDGLATVHGQLVASVFSSWHKAEIVARHDLIHLLPTHLA